MKEVYQIIDPNVLLQSPLVNWVVDNEISLLLKSDIAGHIIPLQYTKNVCQLNNLILLAEVIPLSGERCNMNNHSLTLSFKMIESTFSITYIIIVKINKNRALWYNRPSLYADFSFAILRTCDVTLLRPFFYWQFFGTFTLGSRYKGVSLSAQYYPYK